SGARGQRFVELAAQLSTPRRTRSLPLALALVLASAAAARAQATDQARLWAQLSRLSLDVRSQPLSAEERALAATRLRRAPLDRVYAQYLETWLEPDRSGPFYRQFLQPWLPAGPLPQFLPLASFRDASGDPVLFLPNHPCSSEQSVLVRPWWRAQPVRICADS